VYKIYTDHLGTPRRLSDETGAIIWSWEGKPFGESTPQNPQNLDFNLRFSGQYYDAETSTHYNINRDYNPQTGRYLQSDPIGYDGGVNNYGYVGGKVLSSVDEMGLVTYIVVNLADNHYYVPVGWHVGMVVVSSTQAKSFYYDPAGGFQIYNTQSGGYTGNPKLSASSRSVLDMDGDTDGIYQGGKGIPISIKIYQEFQARLGTKISTFTINTTATQEASLLKQAKITGNDGNCAHSVTTVLSKTIFPKSITLTNYPSNVNSQMLTISSKK